MKASNNLVTNHYLSLEARLICSLAFKTHLVAPEEILAKADSLNIDHCIWFAKKHSILQLIEQTEEERTTNELNLIQKEVNKSKVFYIANHLKRVAEFIFISRLLDENKVHFILFKGLDISLRFYEKAYQRPSSDLDLLIGRADLKRAYKLLAQNGFTISKLNQNRLSQRTLLNIIHHSGYFGEALSFSKEKLDVDVHPIEDKKFAELLASSERRKIKTQEYNSLSMLDNLEGLLKHARKHNFHKAIWIYDLNLILSEFSESDLKHYYELLTRRGVGREFKVALMLARTLCPIELSSTIDRTLLSDSHCNNSFHFTMTQISLTEESWKRVIFNLRTQMSFEDSLRGKLIIILKKLFYPTLADFSCLTLPIGLSMAYYILRPLRIILKLAGAKIYSTYRDCKASGE